MTRVYFCKKNEMVQKKYKHILWDLDGTLIDSKAGVTSSIIYCLKHFNIEVDCPDELKPMIGPPLQDSLREIYHFSPQQIDIACRLYDEYYMKKGIYDYNVFQYIEKVLSQLQNKKRELYVATTKPEYAAKLVLADCKLDTYFKFIGGDNKEFTRSNKVNVIQYVLSENNISTTDDVVMIGDRKYDMLAAQKIGIDTIGVLYGYGDRSELLTNGAQYVIEDPCELLNLLKG